MPGLRLFAARTTAGLGSDRLEALALGYSGLRARFDVVLRPGWCLMQSRFILGGMAATEEEGVTRFALVGGIRGPRRLIAPVTQPLTARISERALARLTQRVQRRSP